VKNRLWYNLLFMSFLFFALTSITAAQAISPTQYAVIPPPPPPPPINHFELQYFQCDPLSCESTGGPFFDGGVSTTAVGPCFSGITLTVGAQSNLNNCTSPYFLSSSASSESTFLTIVSGSLARRYILEGLEAQSSIFDDFGSTVSFYSETKWCNGVTFLGIPQASPC
jgi:hypothetical protein